MQEVTEQINKINGKRHSVLGIVFWAWSFSCPLCFRPFIVFITQLLFQGEKLNKPLQSSIILSHVYIELLRMSTFILFSGSVSNMHCCSYPAPISMTASSKGGAAHGDIWMNFQRCAQCLYDISYMDIWALIQSCHSLTMYIFFWFELHQKQKWFRKQFASVLGSVSSPVWLAFKQRLVLKGGPYYIIQTNHQAATTSLIAEHCCTAFTNEQKQPNSS